MTYYPIFIVLHAGLALALIGVVLLQRTDSSGFTSSQSNFSGMLSSRGSKTFLSRVTAALATLFFISSLGLTILAKDGSSEPASILDSLESLPGPVAPSVPAEPLVPVSE